MPETNDTATLLRALFQQIEITDHRNAEAQTAILTEVKSIRESVGAHAVTLGKVESFMQAQAALNEKLEAWRDAFVKAQDERIKRLEGALNWARGIGAAVAGGLALAEFLIHAARLTGH